MRRIKTGFGFAALTSIVAISSIAYCFSDVPLAAVGTADHDSVDRSQIALNLDPSTAFSSGTGWINGQPSPDGLRGKVILVNFWTYSCINSLRPLPYLRAWAEKYRDRGLVVIGVHTPEFAFERDETNVARAAMDLGVDYPIALDNRYGIWRRFGNDAWPGFYFVDARGTIRYRRLGEGRYEEAEQLIRQLLAEADPSPLPALSVVRGQGKEAEADWSNIGSPETYVGYRQARSFASLPKIMPDHPIRYEIPATLRLNSWGVGGAWTVGEEYAQLDAPGGKIAFRFHARDLHMVLGRKDDNRPIRFRVTIDGKRPGSSRGTDTDSNGVGTINQNRLYQLVRQSGDIGDRTFEIEFLDPGVRAYSFTFG